MVSLGIAGADLEKAIRGKHVFKRLLCGGR